VNWPSVGDGDPIGSGGFTNACCDGDDLNRFTCPQVRISGQNHTGSFFRAALSIIDVSQYNLTSTKTTHPPPPRRLSELLIVLVVEPLIAGRKTIHQRCYSLPTRSARKKTLATRT